jgi:inhibitor of KinA sporulation pathway (predicted exonuclease)
MTSFADKLTGEVDEGIQYQREHTCDKCCNNSKSYFIHMNIDNKDKYICSYICSKDMQETYGNDYWDDVVNLEDFNNLRPIVKKVEKVEKFSIDRDPMDGERYEFFNKLDEEDIETSRIEEEYGYSSSSCSDYDSE